MLFLVNQTMIDLGLGTSGLVSLLGYAVVFVGLIFLMIVISIVGKIMTSAKKAPAPVVAAEPAKPVGVPAPGAAGELKLYDVEPKDAALIMAIVAYKTGKPINCLRFKSIKEIK